MLQGFATWTPNAPTLLRAIAALGDGEDRSESLSWNALLRNKSTLKRDSTSTNERDDI